MSGACARPQFTRYQRSRGLCIPLWKNLQLEVWFCPAGEHIRPHVHAKTDSFIVCLWGRMKWTVQYKSREVFGPFRRRNSDGTIALAAAAIPRTVRHGALARTFSIFLNWERADEPVSAAHDFIAVP